MFWSWNLTSLYHRPGVLNTIAWLLTLYNQTVTWLQWWEIRTGWRIAQDNPDGLLVCPIHLHLDFCSLAFLENCRHPPSASFSSSSRFCLHECRQPNPSNSGFHFVVLFFCKSNVSKKGRVLVPGLFPCSLLKRNSTVLSWVAAVSLL